LTSNKAVTMARSALNGKRIPVQIMLDPEMREFVQAQPGGQQEYVRRLIGADMKRQEWVACGEYFKNLCNPGRTDATELSGSDRTDNIESSQTGTRPDNATIQDLG
jgi:hypothetical protein